MKKILFFMVVCVLPLGASQSSPSKPLHIFVVCVTWRESEEQFRALSYWGDSETKDEATHRVMNIFAAEHPGKVPSTVDPVQIPDDMVSRVYNSRSHF